MYKLLCLNYNTILYNQFLYFGAIYFKVSARNFGQLLYTGVYDGNCTTNI